MNERIHAGFALKGDLQGGGYIVFEEHTLESPNDGQIVGLVPELAIQKLGFLALEFYSGVPKERAQQILDLLNDNIQYISFTDHSNYDPIG